MGATKQERSYQTDVLEREEEPPKYAVVLYNDDYTTMDFVVLVLMTIFHKSQPDATSIMLTIHQEGKGVGGIYDYEIAETKAFQVHKKASSEGFPLRCTIEEVKPSNK